MTEPALGNGVQSVQRAFELLDVIAEAGGESTLSGLSSATGFPPPTIHRLLRTLVVTGYVRQLPSRRYALGPRLIRLGEAATIQFGALAQPHLKPLAAQLGETLNMATLDSNMAIYIAQAPSAHSMRILTEIGCRAHLHLTGVGKAILAQLPDDRVREMMASTGMPSTTGRSIRTIDVLLADLDRIRELGYSTDDEEHDIGVRCYAVAVPNAPTPTAISVLGPVTRVDATFRDRAIPLLHQTALGISADVTVQPSPSQTQLCG